MKTTMAYAMEAVAKAGIAFYVLDRPNPITGVRVEGPLLDAGNKSFVGYWAGMPVRHGMTMGELARLFNAENKIGAALTVIPMQDWNRGDWFDSTDLPWISPSPNMRSLKAAILYPGLCLLGVREELSCFGAREPTPLLNKSARISSAAANWRLTSTAVKSLVFGPIPPASRPRNRISKASASKACALKLPNRELLDATRLGLEVAAAIQKLYPGRIDFPVEQKLIGSNEVIRQLRSGEDPRTIQQSFMDSVSAFVKLREQYLIPAYR